MKWPEFKLDKKPNENNWNYCKRYAEECPAENIVRRIVASLISEAACSNHDEFNRSEVVRLFSELTCHGHGFSTAFVNKYWPECGE